MTDGKRMIDANDLWSKTFICDEVAEVRKFIEQAPTVAAVEVKCKVGAWVYALWEAPVKERYIIYCAEVKEIRISVRNCRLTTTYILEPVSYRGLRREYRDNDFGKLVFLEESEAQAALCGERREGE